MRPVRLFGVVVQDLTLAEWRGLVESWFQEPRLHTIVTPNPEMILQARKDPSFAETLNRADASVPDGVGLQYAAAAFGDRLEHRHAGVDLLKELAAICVTREQPLLLLGGKNGSAERAAQYLHGLYPGLNVHAYDPGPIEWHEGVWHLPPGLRDFLRVRRPAAVAIGLGQGKQEAFAEDILADLPFVRVSIGVGGAFEMLAGALPRAPERWRRGGFEWLWRLWLEPRRFVRIFRAVVIFPAVVALATLKQRRFFRACTGVLQFLLAKR